MYRDIAGQDQLAENHIIKSRGMEKTSRIAWICGAAAVVLGFFGLLATLDWKRNEKMTLHIGTYGEHIYRYSFDKKSLEFSLAGKAEARNASYVLPAADAVYAVSECGEESEHIHSVMNSWELHPSDSRPEPTLASCLLWTDTCLQQTTAEVR